ncbi:MAG: DNA cytosine methyltransferase [Planctomycetes bacterium]|nr:DNA cytosine methyltransferase [Planctomycetota bacterium]
MGRKLKIISLYTGAGGLDYGFEAARFKTAVAVEMDAACCRTLRYNRKWPVIERSIYEVPTQELLEVAGLDSGEADVLIGGPPCQPFSKSGYWAHGDALRLEDPRAQTLAAYLRVLEEAQPRAFLLENVEGLSYAGKSEGLKLLLDAIKKINKRTGSSYQPEFSVLSSAAHGVPQMRNRFFMVGARDGSRFSFPSATHAARPEETDGELFEGGELKRYSTAWDALADVEPDPDEDLAMRGKWARLLPSVPEGENYLWHTDRGGGLPLFGWRRRFWSFLLKLAKDRPSWTIQAQPGPAVGPFHWSSRRLSRRELCRLQTFPDDVEILGSRTAIQKQIGNAVPSALAEVLAREIRRQFLGMRPIKGCSTLLPPDRGDPPSPEPVERVVADYRHLAGEHEAHPGTGKGHAAAARVKVRSA